MALASDSSGELGSLSPGWAVVLDGAGHTRTNIGVPGRMDHMAYDPSTHRLFIAALENGSMEVIDVGRRRRVGSIARLEEPQGVALIPDQHCVAVACGGDGRLRVFDTRTFQERHALVAGDDADNVRFDAPTGRLFVAVGNLASGALVEFDVRSWKKVREIPFSSHPESFQLDPDGDRIYVNVPGGVRALHDGTVAFASRRSGAVTGVLPLAGRGRNFPMALDPARGRLFVATRRPARIIEIDIASRRIVSEATCVDDSDDLFIDVVKHRLVVSAGGFRPDVQSPIEASPLSPAGSPGTLDVFETGRTGLVRKFSTPTAWHARTCLLIASRKEVYVAVPLNQGLDPEIREYRLK